MESTAAIRHLPANFPLAQNADFPEEDDNLQDVYELL